MSAHVFDGDLTVSRGTVSNISESGAFLITDRGLARGATVRVVLSEGRDGLLDTQARIVWSADGLDPHSEIVGSLQGILFSDLSPLHRDALRRRLFFADVLQSGFLEKFPPEEEELSYILIDPDIELLISDHAFAGASMDYENGIEEIRRELEPYLEQYVSRICSDIGKVGEAAGSALDYLEHQVPNYPFDRELDGRLMAELVTSFPRLDLLEEVKTFRWCTSRESLTRTPDARATLRRWILNSAALTGRQP
jgi:hypothetical protein